jgi:apolipoprotein N-acyltransferase
MTARVPAVARWLAAATLGAVSVFGFAPYGIAPLPIVTLACLFLLWRAAPRPRSAAATGFAYGLGFFLAGTSWIYVSLHTFGGMPAPLTAVATFVFCAIVACYPAIAGWLSRWAAGRSPTARLDAVWLLVGMPACWTIGELLRGTLLSGFPWLGLGYSQVPSSPLAGFAPLLGSHGVTLAAAVCAGAMALLVGRIVRRPFRAAAVAAPVGVAVLAIAAGALLRGVAWTSPAGQPVSVALLQGNVAQERKFSPEVLPVIFREYRHMIERTSARLVILPETAFPIFLHQLDPDYLDAIASHVRARQGDVLFGVAIADPIARAYFNGIVSAGTSPPQAYRKHHLVPFGEFLPLRPLFGWVLDVLNIPMADFTPGPDDSPPLAAAGQQLALSICYEDAFGSEMRRQLPAATLLVNVSNDAWFGDSLAAEQHWQIAQMRALESGRMMLRANNTGVTGIIDTDGRAVARLPGFVNATLEGVAQGRTGATPYVRIGEWGTVLLAAVALLAFAAAARRSGMSPTSIHPPNTAENDSP